MNDFQLFLLTRVEEPWHLSDLVGFNLSLEAWGNLFLTPVRVLFHGRKVQIVQWPGGRLREINHVASFHRAGDGHHCRTNDDLHSGNSSWILTLISIACLIPGIIIGSILKGLAYYTETTRQRHALMKRHFTPIDLHVGTTERRVNEWTEAIDFGTTIHQHSHYNQKVRSITIWGDGALTLSTDEGLFRRTNPKKIYLIDTRITNVSHLNEITALLDALLQGEFAEIRDAAQARLFGHLDATLVQEGKYEDRPERQGDDSFVVQHDMPSLEVARADRPPRGKHRIYRIRTLP